MPQILTVTLNPALDLATSAPKIAPGPKLRCGPETAETGGGGVNVARAITQLGGQAAMFVALGGPNGEHYQSLLAQMGLHVIAFEAPGETRHSFTVTDQTTGGQYRFVLSGPRWSAAQLARMQDALAAHAASDAFVVLSGSMPPGAEPGLIPQICARLGPERRVVVDTSGAHLEAQAKGPSPRPDVLRMDSHEAQALSGQALDSRADSAGFAETLRQRGAGRVVIIARGKDGSVMANGEGLWHVNAANDHVVSAVGAGDSFVGAFVMSLADGLSEEEALRRGAAAAAAAVMSAGSQLCLPQDYAALLDQSTLRRL